MRVVIVEDSRLARSELKALLAPYADIAVVAEAENAEQAVKLVETHRPDVLFLDIQLPGQDGFWVLETLEHLPHVIFTTAYDQYAIKSFEYNALDYLLKPINAARLEQAIKKINTQPDTEKDDRLNSDSKIFLKDGERCWLASLQDIALFESCGNYSRVYFKDNKPLIPKSLGSIEKRLHPQQFFRISRQHIVNLHYVADISLWVNGNYRLVMQDGMELDVSRNQSARLKMLLSL
ncbi:LytTR family DNA-binding domain-containing protein [Aestuariibacter halophilus]|uniref:LytTR family DNA-binding domain-containing protein n=1 Tax=Fluctibacter halophilus TaxID=226011 RepID=A0ABS8G2Z2_9ALTE|nr:LytTR family DNA-binding domain-containing protein [Aestuariibacter halophilus]MCC2614967.1 LytTR family DNA-binding domain-containing protein [Aestuariibacter halophilus]